MLARSRRRFLQGTLALAGLGLLSGCGPATSFAPQQRPTRPFRIGTLVPNAVDAQNLAGLVQGLRDLGWVEGQDVVFDHRFARVAEGLAARVGELIDLKVDVIVAAGNEAIRAASAATGAIPIVMAMSDDPVGAGLIASIAHPVGNVTGVTNIGAQLRAKRLQLVKEVAPGIVRVSVVWDRDVLGGAGIAPELSAAARALSLQLDPRPVSGGTWMSEALVAETERGADAILFVSDSLIPRLYDSGYIKRMRLPAMAEDARFARAGGLVAYGPDVAALFRQAAIYVDKILKGAKPADLPVEQPTKFDFAINLKTARELGLTISSSVLQQATEVIQ